MSVSVQQKCHYKDASPRDTVQRIQDILRKAGIEIEEYWSSAGTDITSSLRIQVKGSTIGTNGKGISREYASASAYSEFMERYQNMILSRSTLLWENYFPFTFYIDEKIVTAEEIVQEDTAFFKLYWKERQMEDASKEKKVQYFIGEEKLDSSQLDTNEKIFKSFTREDYDDTIQSIKKGKSCEEGGKNSYICLPFYNIATKKMENIPYYLLSMYYASNGMCAGNTEEEALVQGLSEIIERYVQKRIILEKISLPDIPISYIKEYSYIYEMYQKIKASDDYQIFFKDASLGGKYPVAALFVVEKNTGRYGVKLGCHPDYGIAMERAVTEAAQGNSLFEYVNRSKFDFENQHVENSLNILNGFKVGFSQFPYEIFSRKCRYEFTRTKDVSQKENKEILQTLVSEIERDGFEILIRNVSILGYPSYHILIPGMSEVFSPDKAWIDAKNVKFHISKLIHAPHCINEENYEYIIRVMDYFANSYLDYTMSSYYNTMPEEDMPGEELGMGWLYYSAMCCAQAGQLQKALQRMELLLAKSGQAADSFYLAVKYYLSGMLIIENQEEVLDYISVLFDKLIAEKIRYFFRDNRQIIEKQYPMQILLKERGYKKEEFRNYQIFAELTDWLKAFQCHNSDFGKYDFAWLN